MMQTDNAAETVIVGVGATGRSVARFLAARGVPFTAADSRRGGAALTQFASEFPQVPLHTGAFADDSFIGVGQLIVSPGVAVESAPIRAARTTGTEIIGDIELFARHANAPVIAITGSNGKSTVTTLVGDMIAAQGYRVAVGGNLGTPALDLLHEEVQYYVLELSSFQLETTASLHAAVSVVLNVSPDHMDRYADLDSYRKAKQRIYWGGGHMVMNIDDPQVMAMREAGRDETLFTLAAPTDGEFGLRTIGDEAWLCDGHEQLLPISAMPIKGRHNVANALAALAIGDAIDLDHAEMMNTLRAFRGLPHRCEWLGSVHGIDWFNDSKGTNVGATVAALEGLDQCGNLVLIAGGEGKGQDFVPLGKAIAAHCSHVVLIGRDAPRIADAVDAQTPVTIATDMRSAVQLAAELAAPGAAVVLSPACASFDMFDDYQARGDAFRLAVAELQR